MKEFGKFLVWQWRKWQLWQRWFILGMLLQLAGWVSPDPWHTVLLFSGIGIVFAHMVKWWVWDTARESWARYKEDRNKLFGVIKDSDC